jgi:shikimate kinase
MDTTNKITITCNNWDKRVDIAQAVADSLGINMLDIDDYIIRGSVMNGDLENYSKDEFTEKYEQSVFNTLEAISYHAYVDTVKEPFVISLGNSKNELNLSIYRKTISIHIAENGEKGVSSVISDYTIPMESSTSMTAKKITEIVKNDGRWSNSL